MTPLDRALIEKTGHDNGFEYVLAAEGNVVRLGSARHGAQVSITRGEGGYSLTVASAVAPQLPVELARSFPAVAREDGAFLVAGHAELARLLRRAAALAKALPNQAAVDFEAEVRDAFKKFSAESIKDTEVERLVRQRVGQQVFRQAMLDY